MCRWLPLGEHQQSAPRVEMLGQARSSAAEKRLLRSTKAFAAPVHSISYLADPGFTGLDQFSFTVDDGRGGRATGKVYVSLQAVVRNAIRLAAAMKVGVVIFLNSPSASLP
jgi:Bacterial Ig domain